MPNQVNTIEEPNTLHESTITVHKLCRTLSYKVKKGHNSRGKKFARIVMLRRRRELVALLWTKRIIWFENTSETEHNLAIILCYLVYKVISIMGKTDKTNLIKDFNIEGYK